MGWKTTSKTREMQDAAKIWSVADDTLIGSILHLAIKQGGGVLFGQNRAGTAISVTLYEPGEKNPPQYANTTDELFIVLVDLYNYVHQKVKGEPPPEAPGGTTLVRTKA